MPPVVAAAVAAVVTVGGALIGGATVGGALLLGGATFALGLASHFLAPKPKIPEGLTSGLGDEARGRSVIVRGSAEPHRIIFGEIVTSGVLVAAFSTGTKNEFFHMVVALAGHEVESIGDVWLNDTLSTDARFSGLVRINKHTGKDEQAADSDLVAEVTDWTTAHRLRGIAYLYLRLKWDQNVWVSGVPNVRAKVQGKKVWDPRATSVSITSSGVGDPTTIATGAAHGLVAGDKVFITGHSGSVPLIDGEYEVLSAPTSTTFTIDVNVTTGGTGGSAYKMAYSTDAALCQLGYLVSRFGINAKTKRVHASSWIAAANICDEDVTIDPGPPTTQKRYTADGSFKLDRRPADIMEDLLTASAGSMVYQQGTYRGHAGAYTTPTVTLDEDDLRAELTLFSKPSRKDLFNAVRGTFADEDNNYQATDFPPVTNSTYEAEDGNVRIFRDIELPFTVNNVRAQRIAKIHLERGRQAIKVRFPAKLTALELAGWDTAMIRIARLGWDPPKIFRILEWNLSEEGGVDLMASEEASTAYDWSAGEQTEHDPAPDTTLPSPFDVPAPGSPSVTEALYITRDGSGVKAKATLSWASNGDEWFDFYQVEYKLASTSTWTVAGRTPDLSFEILDIAPGIYDFRVKAINVLAVSSPYAVRSNVELLGLLAPPAAPSGVTISRLGGLAVIRWDRHPDLDVRMGGQILFRHSQAQVGAGWTESAAIGDAIPGAETVAILPLKPGSYLLKAQDSLGIRSLTAAVVSTDGATVLAYVNVSQVDEHPTFSGIHADTAVVDGILKLDGQDAMDLWGNVDDISNWDSEGGVSSSGTYDFAGGFDFLVKKRVRLMTLLDLLTVNVLDNIDSRSLDIDLWEDFDGISGSPVDAQVWARHTDDDPGGSPAWTAWERLDSDEFNARAVDLQARLKASDPAYNIHLNQLSVKAEELV